MNNGNDYFGPRFCPECGCNIKAVAMAIALARGQTTRPMKNVTAIEEPRRRRTRSAPIPETVIAEVMQRRKARERPKAIASALNLTYSQINYILYQKSRTLGKAAR